MVDVTGKVTGWCDRLMEQVGSNGSWNKKGDTKSGSGDGDVMDDVKPPKKPIITPFVGRLTCKQAGLIVSFASGSIFGRHRF